MKLFKTICTFLLVLVVTSTSLADLYDPVSVGPRASALGGAYIGLADDLTSIYWNPAGLVRIEGQEFIVNVRHLNEIQKEYLAEDDEFAHFGLGFAGIGSHCNLFDREFFIGVGMERQLEPGNYYIFEECKTNIFTISPAIALKIKEGISFGIGFNIWTGSMDGAYSHFTFPGGDTYYRLNVDNDYSGINFSLGGLWDLQKNGAGLPVRIGVVLKTPFKLHVDREQKVDLGTHVSVSTQETDFELPLMMGIGLVYQPLDNFLLTADFEKRFWKNCQFSNKSSSGASSTGYMSSSRENINQIRLGAEYQLSLGKSILALRGGGAIIPTLNADYDGSEFTSQVISYLFSGGIGYSYKNISLNAAWYQQQYEIDNDTYKPKSIFQVLQFGGKINLDLW